MTTRNTVLSTLGAASVLVLLLARPAATQEPPRPKNLKVLRADIPQPELAAIMKSQAKALGVKCDFCHVQGDASKDDKPKKMRAREMMKMTMDLNATTFKDTKEKVECWTCHRGKEEPDLKPPDVPAP